MKLGDVVEDKQINGQHVIIRYIKEDDLHQIVEHQNILSSEQTFINSQGDRLTIDSGLNQIKEMIENIEQGEAVALLLLVDDQFAGVCQVVKQKRGAMKHTSTLGISLQKPYRGKGYGKLLLNALLTEAIKNIKGLEIIKLGCYSEHEVAVRLYKSLGFVEYGRLPRGFKRSDGYHEELLMYKDVKKD